MYPDRSSSPKSSRARRCSMSSVSERSVWWGRSSAWSAVPLRSRSTRIRPEYGRAIPSRTRAKRSRWSSAPAYCSPSTMEFNARSRCSRRTSGISSRADSSRLRSTRPRSGPSRRLRRSGPRWARARCWAPSRRPRSSCTRSWSLPAGRARSSRSRAEATRSGRRSESSRPRAAASLSASPSAGSCGFRGPSHVSSRPRSRS